MKERTRTRLQTQTALDFRSLQCEVIVWPWKKIKMAKNLIDDSVGRDSEVLSDRWFVKFSDWPVRWCEETRRHREVVSTAASCWRPADPVLWCRMCAWGQLSRPAVVLQWTWLTSVRHMHINYRDSERTHRSTGQFFLGGLSLPEKYTQDRRTEEINCSLCRLRSKYVSGQFISFIN